MQNNHQRGNRLFPLSCIMFIMGGLHAGALGVVWIYVEADFGLTLSALGALVSAATVGRLITSMSAGPLIKRFGVATVLIAGVGITGASLLGFALTPYWGVVLLAAFFSGIGSGAMAACINAFAAIHFSARQMNWLHGSFGIGSTIGPLVITTIVIDLGLDWRYAYVLFAAMRAVILVGFILTRAEWTAGDASQSHENALQAGLRQTMRLPLVWLMVATFAIATGVELVAGQFANNFLIEARAIEPKLAGTWVSFYWASLTISRFLCGLIITRVGSENFLRLASGCIMLGAMLLASEFAPLSSLAGLALIGFAIAPFAPLMTSDTPLRVGNGHVANAVGLQFTGASLGMAVLPWLAGTLGETYGIAIMPGFLFITALVTFALHEGMLRFQASRLTASTRAMI